MSKWVYLFSASKTEGKKEMKNLLGGKGANLAEMSNLALPVPPGFTITTEACLDFGKRNKVISEEIKQQVDQAIAEVEKLTNKKFGGENNPLLFSVRSGARTSMPGMMDTVLNLGLNEKSTAALAKLSGSERFAWDSYRRFIQMYSDVVLGVNHSILGATLEDLKDERGVESDTELTADDLKDLVQVYLKILITDYGISFPTDPYEQLWGAIAAVFSSWDNPRAKKYREIHHIDHYWGTAVNVQSMVFGNLGETSCTGVAFTRDPSTGEKKFFGEFLVNAQGEDVVAGIRTPLAINQESVSDQNKDRPTMQELMPEVYQQLVETYQTLENHYRDMQDIEFTVENKNLFILQTRNGKRTTSAAIKIAVDLVNERKISKEEALKRINPEDLNQLLHPRLDPSFEKQIMAKGLPASPGAASGRIVFDAETAQTFVDKGDKALLVRLETSPEDIGGMAISQGVLTSRGGMTSHAAVVARGMGIPCVAGCGSLIIDYTHKKLTISGKEYQEGDYLTIDGGTGEVIDGEVPTKKPEFSQNFKTFMQWADEYKTLNVRTNADNAHDAKVALDFGAVGIGLCRTEHMFFDPERILVVREMIFASNKSEREKALAKLLPFQKDDFLALFKVMDGNPVNIRLLDPPLHEFLPHSEAEMLELSEYLKIGVDEIKRRKNNLSEFNPMLGHRGCRLAITYPEIYIMQTKAIMEAACLAQAEGARVIPEIMLPLIGIDNELSQLRNIIEDEIQTILKERNQEISYKLGTMIELPRAAITADKIAMHADFFSFGTNDLTQTVFGLSRDDAGRFLPIYVDQGIIPKDPFVSLDQEGVGFLIKHATRLAKQVNPNIHTGICGEHGGDPSSITFCHQVGLDYVSCSPYRVPIARLAAAQAALG